MLRHAKIPAWRAGADRGQRRCAHSCGAAAIEFREATKRYAGQTRYAVDHLTLRIEPGEICVLVGPSGGGKTTAMKMVNRLVDITEGDVLIDGRERARARRDGAAARHRLRDPAGRPVPAPDGRRQRRHRPAPARLATGADPRARRRAARARRASSRRVPRALPGPALGRPAPARRPRARARRRPAAHAHGRAVRRARPDHARAPAGRVPAPAGRRCARRSSSSRTTSTRRSARRPHRDPARGRRPRPVRHARTRCSRIRPTSSSRASSAPTAGSSGSRCAARRGRARARRAALGRRPARSPATTTLRDALSVMLTSRRPRAASCVDGGAPARLALARPDRRAARATDERAGGEPVIPDFGRGLRLRAREPALLLGLGRGPLGRHAPARACSSTSS